MSERQRVNHVAGAARRLAPALERSGGGGTRPRWTKVRRDFWFARGRVALMMLAIVFALTGVGALLTARAVVLREATTAYRATNPAAATIDLEGGAGAALLEQVRNRPGVADVTARQTVTTRVLVGGEWRRMLLFVVAPDDPLRISRFRVDAGAWPPPDDAILLERAAGPVVGAGPGGQLDIAGPTGGTTRLRVTGTVYDPALAPAAQERTGYGYLTPAALARLGHRPVAEQLKVAFTARADADARAADLAAWLTTQGRTVHEVQVPPYRHPHQNQTDTITELFLGFAVAALALAGVLVAATLGGMLAAQTRQIGVLKTVGATTGQVLRMYLTAVALLAAASTALAALPALAAGYGLVDVVGKLLNIDIADRGLPWWAPVTYVAAGLGIPVLVALAPLTRAARLTVRAALADEGGDARTGTRRSDRWLTRLRAGMAVRNLQRRRGRLIMTVALLAAGGALFTTGLNNAAAWRTWVDEGLARRTYDAEVQLTAPVTTDTLTATVRAVAGVTAVEPVLSLPATPATATGQAEVQRTYPDGGHGRFQLTALPADTRAVHFEVLEGRWLRAADTGGIVLNQGAATRLGDPGIGADVRLVVEGRAEQWKVVGVVAEVGGPATAYIVAPDRAGSANAVRFSTTGDLSAVERALAGAGLPVAATLPTSELRSAIDQHVAIFIYTLIVLAVLMAAVGLLGLASTMSITVTERTREYGIMQTLGATPATIRRLVLTEGTLTGLIGCVAALALGLPLSGAVGRLLGTLAFGLPLPLSVSRTGLVLWPVLALTGAAAATLTAAVRASRLTVRETLTRS